MFKLRWPPSEGFIMAFFTVLAIFGATWGVLEMSLDEAEGKVTSDNIITAVQSSHSRNKGDWARLSEAIKERLAYEDARAYRFYAQGLHDSKNKGCHWSVALKFTRTSTAKYNVDTYGCKEDHTVGVRMPI